DYGWEATVLAPRNGAYHRDPSLAFPEAKVIRTGTLELSRAGKQLLRTGGDDVSAATVSGGRRLIKTFMRRHAYFPDAQIGWYAPAVLSARMHVKQGEYDAIFSSSFPVTAHLVARTLSERFEIPWVAEFRDPWSAGLPGTSPIRDRAAKLEAAIGREASAVVTVSPSWAQRFETAWSRPVSVIRNGHDGLPPARAVAPSDVITLGYLGTYYPETQDLGAIWRAVRQINDAGGAQIGQIRFIGAANAKLADVLAAEDLQALAHITGFLPHDQALRELSNAAVLLVAGPCDGSGVMKGQVAAKLSEYLATQRPVIYVGDPDGDAADLVREFPGTFVVATGDVDAARAALIAAASTHVDRDVGELSRHALTGRLASILNGVSSQP
ncbi:MAG: glycosyltransferase, partial [Sciscionella sp.]